MLSPAPDWRLMPGGYVRRRIGEEPAEAPEQVKLDVSELMALVWAQARQLRHPPVRIAVDFVRPAGGVRDEGRPVLRGEYYPRAVYALSGDYIVKEIPSRVPEVGLYRGKYALGPWRHERVGVDLAVRVRLGYSDLATAVLEAVHLLHPGLGGELGRPVDERLQDEADPIVGELGERRLVVRGITDHLAAAGRRSASATSGCAGPRLTMSSCS